MDEATLHSTFRLSYVSFNPRKRETRDLRIEAPSSKRVQREGGSSSRADATRFGVFLPNKTKRLQCRNTEASFVCVTKHGQHAILFSVSYCIIFCIRRQAICCMSYKKPLPDHFLLCRSFEEIVSLYLYICHAETRLYRYIWQRLCFENSLLAKIHRNRIRNIDFVICIAIHYCNRKFEGLKLIL